jgi:hypothetical protein
MPMRSTLTMLSLVLLAALSGCETFRWGLFRREPLPPVPGTIPSGDALVSYLNDNARRIDSLRCTDIDITASKGLQTFGIRGKMMAMKPRDPASKPRYFLMSATALGSPMVDLGSNENEFWFWISKADPPYQFFCSYKDYEEGRVARLPLPFQPEWIMETLGMGPYGPAEKYSVENDATTVRLIEKTRSPQGQPVRKVIVMNRREVKAPSPQVQAYLLIDDTSKKEICSAQIQDVQLDARTGALIPRRIELRWPAENARLNMILSGLEINVPLEVGSFQRQPLQGVQSYDLARSPQATPSSLQRTEAIAP